MAGVNPNRQQLANCFWPSVLQRLALARGMVIPAAFFLLVLALLTLALVLAAPARAQGPDGTTGSGPAAGGPPYDEAVALAIDRMLMCPVCPGETIDQSQVELARQMRLRVREMLGQGATRQEVLDFFVDRYGVEVLAAPPKSGFNLVAWILPALAVPAALAAGFLALRAMRRRPGSSPGVGPQPDAGLDPYLEKVDRELAGGAPVAQPREDAATHG
jgi:cytochrome c-type biogenesis protein CcmH